jgi:hypothetical protein
MSRFSGPLTPSVEALLYRGESPLFHELKLVYADVVAGDQAALTRVSSVLRTHTHMDISVQLFESETPDIAIYFIPFDVNNLLRDPALQKHEGMSFDIAKYKSLLDGGQAAVDSKGAVSGVFTLIPATILISTGLIRSGILTNDELAAVTLHEVGHLYNYFDVMGRTLATSFVIQDAQAMMAQTTDLTKRQQIVDLVSKTLEFEMESVDLAAVGQEKAFEAIVIRNTVAKIQSDLGDSKLFGGEVEFMADSYAVHSGAAKALASGSTKLHKHDGHLETYSRTEYIVTEACKTALFLGGMLFPPTLPVTALISGLCIAYAGRHAHDRNTPIERLESVHADLVNLLKDTSLPRELKESLLADVQFVSGLREQMVERSTLVIHLWRSLSPSKRHTYKQIKLQREIGKLVNNDIFAKAAKLSTLTSE